jgi:TetR/AcrR family transcriptional repressor of nem operon
MRYSSEHKAETRQRIVRHAAEQFRSKGFNGIGVADLMKEAGLTHGGFYAHFKSKDALFAEAVDAGAGQTFERLEKAAADAGPGNGLQAIRDRYVSAAHRDRPQAGCTLAALGADAGRLDNEVREHFDAPVERLIALLAAQIGGREARAKALRELASMVGALVMSRAVGSRALSNEILETLRPIA